MASDSTNHLQSAKTLAQVYLGLTKDRRIFENSFEESLKLITTTCSKSLDVDRVSVWSFDADSGIMTCLILFDQNTKAFERGAVLRKREIPSYFEALTSQQVVDVDDARADPRTSQLTESYLKPLGIRSMLDATLRFNGRLQGVLCAESTGENRTWTRSEKAFVSSVAELVDQVMILGQLRESESHYRSLFDHSADSIFIVSNGKFVDCNPAAESMYDCSREELLGLNPAAISPEHQPCGRPSDLLARAHIDEAVKGEVKRFEWRHQTLSGKEFDTEVTLSRVPRGDAWYVTEIVKDISAQKQAQLELEKSKIVLEYRALHDSLTGLANRDSFHKDANARITSDVAKDVSQAIFLLDLNRFKEVNDTLGHDFGDEILKVVAERLQTFADRFDHRVYRLGGDEFVLLAEVSSADGALELAEQVLDAFNRSFSSRDIELRIDTCIGIALAPCHGSDSHALLRCADVALYNAKRRAIYISMFDRRFDENDKRHLTLMSDLVGAIENDELMLHYHPRVGLFQDSCTHCEALVRWRHPVYGMIPPDDFIVSAELNNLIHQLTRWALRSALTQLRTWMDQGIEMTVSVNVSARNLVDQRFAEDVKTMLLDHNIPTGGLEIEITESALIVDPIRALESLDSLRESGVSIAIDDFGTGYSSLSYLKRLPVQVLKIDKSFVQDMLSDESDATIVRSIVELAHSFGLIAVAEGVESEETVEALKALHCDQAQGFLFCRPLPADAFEVWLADYEPDKTTP